jgi:hypothetical protein
MAFRRYQLSDHEGLRTTLESLELSKETVLSMARESAPYVDAIWNRRFEQYVLRIEDGVVLAIGFADENRRRTRVRTHGWAKRCTICRGVARIITYEACDVCNGRGCVRCGDGRLTVERICPMARENKGVACSDVLEKEARKR